MEGQGRVTARGCDFGMHGKDVPWLELRGGRADVDGQQYGVPAQ